MKTLRTCLPICAIAVVFTASAASAAARGEFQRTLQVNGNVDLQVETGSGSITVHQGSASEVRVSGHIQATEWFGGNAQERIKRLESNPPIQQSGNDIRIGHIDDPELKHNISISYATACEQRIGEPGDLRDKRPRRSEHRIRQLAGEGHRRRRTGAHWLRECGIERGEGQCFCPDRKWRYPRLQHSRRL
jgi:hypothetical protein